MCENPIFGSWYTDSMAIYRNEERTIHHVDKKERILVEENIPCRIYSTQKNVSNRGDTAFLLQETDKVACDLSVKIKTGDEIFIVRGGMLGKKKEAERYLAGKIQEFYDPVGGVLSGLEHQEIALLQDDFI
ncbi:MAG: hypothetical protein HFG39_15370 [Lachnospiraceae bacterium]|nr:hypothetical protein [Lachnospiraceae bacterium]